MTVDKFGRTREFKKTVIVERETISSSPVALEHVNAHFLRRDGTNVPTSSINMDGKTITNVADPTSDQEVATKAYVDVNISTNRVSKLGDNMHGNLHMNGNRLTGLPTGLTGSGSDAISRTQALSLIRAGTREQVNKHLASFTLRNYVSYIPSLTVNDGKQGFLVSASSELNSRYI